MLGGFQVAALSWRINRETKMEAKCERTWLTCADGFVASSFLVLVVGVFLAPIRMGSIAIAVNWFGLALVLFAPAVFILAGHYNLYGEWAVKYKKDGRKAPRDRVTKQEWVTVGIAVIPVMTYVAWWVYDSI